ncbi:MAG: nucleotidyltransferase family protein [Prevotella sp.]|jgi:hypothetical protein|nr:nucleotidyltransferase family protein [Prevotella sp.]MCI1281496.1 nucleotidyltransferase family protein [Prevotella sp.]
MAEIIITDEFFRLLCNALWHEGEVVRYLDVDEFNALFALAKQQTVPALLADSLVRNNVRINDDCTMLAMSAILKNQRKVRKINKNLAKVASILNEAEIHYVVFKGQISASHYLNPELRTTGDVDFYVIPPDFSRAEQLLEEKLGVKINEDKVDKHFDFNYEGIRYEMHYKIETFGFSRHQKCFNQLIDKEIFENPCSVCINQIDVKTLSPIAEIISTFKHLFNHLLVEGVGLRQLCDLAILLHTYYNKYDRNYLKNLLIRIGYYRAFLAVGAFLIEDLGLPKDEYPFAISYKYYSWSNKLKEDVLKGGNFGKNVRKAGKEGKAKSMQTASIAMKHCLRYFPLAPIDIAFLIPKRMGISLSKYF